MHLKLLDVHIQRSVSAFSVRVLGEARRSCARPTTCLPQGCRGVRRTRDNLRLTTVVPEHDALATDANIDMSLADVHCVSGVWTPLAVTNRQPAILVTQPLAVHAAQYPRNGNPVDVQSKLQSL